MTRDEKGLPEISEQFRKALPLPEQRGTVPEDFVPDWDIGMMRVVTAWVNEQGLALRMRAFWEVYDPETGLKEIPEEERVVLNMKDLIEEIDMREAADIIDARNRVERGE